MSALMDASALKDKSVIITGGASGIGLATATHFADAGAYVTIADLQDAAGQQTAADLAAKGCHVSFIHCDTTNWEQSVSAFKHAAAFAPSKSLDVAVLSAGREGDMGSMMEQVLVLPEPSMDSDTIPPQPKQAAIEVNLKGLVNSAWLSLYYMRLPSKVPIAEPTSKALTVVSSIAGYADMPYNQDYNASKFGVRGMFRGLRHTTAPLNVRVNLIAPYFVKTPLMEGLLGAMESMGVRPGQGLTWADMHHVVDAMTLRATDPSVTGRAFAIWPEGYVDMKDDEQGHYAGPHMQEYTALQRKKGDLLRGSSE